MPRKVVHLQCLKDTWQKPIEEASLLRTGCLSADELVVVPAFAAIDASVLEDATHVTIGGSGWSVFESVPAWAGLERIIRQARDQSLPILGICFGAQALAQIFGGGVIRAEANAEYGTVRVRVTSGPGLDALFQRLACGTFLAQASHWDQIVRLPEDAQKLAWSFVRETVQVTQAFGFPEERVWGVQFHPERDDQTVRALMDHPECSYSGKKRDAIKARLAPSPEANRILAEFLKL